MVVRHGFATELACSDGIVILGVAAVDNNDISRGNDVNFLGTHIESIAQVIQLAVAPVFMLAGVAATLNVLVGRLVRIVDRARLTEGQLTSTPEEQHAELYERLRVLARRGHLISRAIALSVISAVLVPIVIVMLFISAILKVNLAVLIALAFIIALIALAVGLLYFLREVFVATAALTFVLPGDDAAVTQRLRRVVKNS